MSDGQSSAQLAAPSQGQGGAADVEAEADVADAEQDITVAPAQLDLQLTVAAGDVEATTPQQHRPGARKLTAEQAVDIYLRKNERTLTLGTLSTELAQQYGVTAKTVRDVWARKTWMSETMQYWPIVDEQPQSQLHDVVDDNIEDHAADQQMEEGNSSSVNSASGPQPMWAETQQDRLQTRAPKTGFIPGPQHTHAGRSLTHSSSVNAPSTWVCFDHVQSHATRRRPSLGVAFAQYHTDPSGQASSIQNDSLLGAASSSDTRAHDYWQQARAPDLASLGTSRGSIEHRHGTGRPNDRVPPTASFPMDPIDLEDWDFLPFDSYLVPGSLLWQVCETSPQRAAQEFPHAQVVDDVQYDDEGWLTDGELIRHFTSHCQVPDPE